MRIECASRYFVLTTRYRYKIKFPNYLGHNYDASTTNFTYRIDTDTSIPLDITVSFLSPITPTSTLRQSIPASYVTIDVNGEVDVNVYMDVDGRWLSGDTGSQVRWEWDTLNVEDQKDKKPSLQRWQVRRTTELLLTEIRDRAEWGTLHFTGPVVSAALRPRSTNSDIVHRMLAMNLARQMQSGDALLALEPYATRTTTNSVLSVTAGRSLPFPNPSAWAELSSRKTVSLSPSLLFNPQLSNMRQPVDSP